MERFDAELLRKVNPVFLTAQTCLICCAKAGDPNAQRLLDEFQFDVHGSIPAEDKTPEQQEIAQTLFKSQIPPVEKAEFMVSFAAMSPDDQPVVITQAEYMRRMSGNTQFIVITHRRGTMEEADMLYGVTMQEKGVSTVLNIDLNEAEKNIS